VNERSTKLRFQRLAHSSLSLLVFRSLSGKTVFHLLSAMIVKTKSALLVASGGKTAGAALTCCHIFKGITKRFFRAALLTFCGQLNSACT